MIARIFTERQINGSSTDAQRSDAQPTEHLFNSEQLLADTLGTAVWVLLGEPGMGKTTAFEALATQDSNAKFITVHQFLDDPADSSWQNQTLYIDALDEYHGRGDPVLRRVKHRLRDLNITRYRLSCRVADWNLRNDTQDAAGGSGGKARVFSLNALSTNECKEFLKSQQHTNPEQFIQDAQRLGFADMLGNPQSLKLLINAAQGNQGALPETRLDAYKLATETLLQEENPRHEKTLSSNNADLLAAAGYVCSVLLLSNRSEIDTTSRQTIESNQALCLSELTAIYADSARSDIALKEVIQHTRLFKRDASNGCYSPLHRTIAEYLAAQYLANRVDDGLPAARVQAWLVLCESKGVDGKTTQHIPNSLRGLAAWLGVLCSPLSHVLISADPIGTLEYGDLSLLSTANKQHLIQYLSEHPNFYYGWGYYDLAKSWLPLVDDGMQPFVYEYLNHYLNKNSQLEQTEQGSSSAVVLILLSALLHVDKVVTPKQSQWLALLEQYVRQVKLHEPIRELALAALLVHSQNLSGKLDTQSLDTEHVPRLLRLLDDCNTGVVKDVEHKLLAQLLSALYPTYVKPAQVFDYLHRSGFDGSYAYINFWGDSLLADVPFDSVLVALEKYIKTRRLTAVEGDQDVTKIDSMLGKVFLTAINTQSATVSIEKLTFWVVQISHDHGVSFLTIEDKDLRDTFYTWQKINPELIKKIIAFRVEHGNKYYWMAHQFVFSGCMPDEMGRFYLSLSQELSKKLDDYYLERSYTCFRKAFSIVHNKYDARYGVGSNSESIDLYDLERHVANNPTLVESFQKLIVSNLLENELVSSSWKYDQINKQRYKTQVDSKQADLEFYLENLYAVAQGEYLKLLSDFAYYLWQKGHTTYPSNHTPSFWMVAFDQYSELREACQKGCRYLLQQGELVNFDDLFSMHAQSKAYTFERPLLLGAKLLFELSPAELLALDETRLDTLLALHLVAYEGNQDWLFALANAKPNLLKNAWLRHAENEFKNSQINSFHWLESALREATLQPLAKDILPDLFGLFPTKFTEQWMGAFTLLLRYCVDHCPAPQLSDLIASRLQKKSVLGQQRIYLLTAGLFVDAQRFENEFESQFESRNRSWEKHAEQLIAFISQFVPRHEVEIHKLPIPVIVRLIKLLTQHVQIDTRPSGISTVTAIDDARRFIYELLSQLKKDTSDAAAHGMADLLSTDSIPAPWLSELRAAAAQQAALRLEGAHSNPQPAVLAKALANLNPVNHADLQAIALDYLADLQKEVSYGALNLKNKFWGVDPNGKKPQAPHRPETDCRDTIAGYLRPKFKTIAVILNTEGQHGAGNQCDIHLQVEGGTTLPIEVKGDWNSQLWTAPSEQLLAKYALDPRCGDYGVYLVLWTGKPVGKLYEKPKTANELQAQLEAHIAQQIACEKTKVFVLDISI